MAFNNTCIAHSFITDWHPGGWFDATCHDMIIFSDTLAQHSEIWVTSPTEIQMIDRFGDTLSMVHFGFRDGLGTSTTDAILPTFKSFPNPTPDQLTVQFPDARSRSWQLVSLTGKTVQRGVFYRTDETLRLKELPVGVYYLRVDGFGIEKVVVGE